MRKRPEIYYFRGIIKDHPFNQGAWENLKLLLKAKKDDPTEWEKPSKPLIGLNR